MSPEATAALLSAAQSDKPRVSVRTDHLREVLAAEQKAAADLELAVGEGTARETMIREQGAHLCLLREDRDDLQGANERQAFRIAELRDIVLRQEEALALALKAAQDADERAAQPASALTFSGWSGLMTGAGILAAIYGAGLLTQGALAAVDWSATGARMWAGL